MSSWHPTLVHFPVALWTLTAMIMVLAARNRPTWLRNTVPVLLAAALIAGLAAFVAGVTTWPWEAVLTSPLGRNKLALTVWTLTFWGGVTWLYWRYPVRLYLKGIKWLPFVLALIGIGFLVMTTTLGLHLAGRPVPQPLGILSTGFEVYTTLVLPVWTLVFVGVSVVILVSVGVWTRSHQH